MSKIENKTTSVDITSPEINLNGETNIYNNLTVSNGNVELDNTDSYGVNNIHSNRGLVVNSDEYININSHSHITIQGNTNDDKSSTVDIINNNNHIQLSRGYIDLTSQKAILTIGSNITNTITNNGYFNVEVENNGQKSTIGVESRGINIEGDNGSYILEVKNHAMLKATKGNKVVEVRDNTINIGNRTSKDGSLIRMQDKTTRFSVPFTTEGDNNSGMTGVIRIPENEHYTTQAGGYVFTPVIYVYNESEFAKAIDFFYNVESGTINGKMIIMQNITLTSQITKYISKMYPTLPYGHIEIVGYEENTKISASTNSVALPFLWDVTTTYKGLNFEFTSGVLTAEGPAEPEYPALSDGTVDGWKQIQRYRKTEFIECKFVRSPLSNTDYNGDVTIKDSISTGAIDTGKLKRRVLICGSMIIPALNVNAYGEQTICNNLLEGGFTWGEETSNATCYNNVFAEQKQV